MRADRYIDALRQGVIAKLQKKAFRMPAGGGPIWHAFGELSRARTWHQFGPNPIGFSDIEAWMRLTRTPLQAHHVRIIRAMDEAFIEHFATPGGQPDGMKTISGRAAQPLTAEVFDALF